MADEFCIPAKAEDLLNEDADLPFKIKRLQNFKDAAPAEVEEYAEGRYNYTLLPSSLCIFCVCVLAHIRTGSLTSPLEQEHCTISATRMPCALWNRSSSTSCTPSSGAPGL